MTVSKTIQNKMRKYADHIGRLEGEKAAINAVIQDEYADAKADGIDVKELRKVIAKRAERND